VLGLWQLNVARDKGRAELVRAAPTLTVADITEVLTPHGSFPSDGTGRRITVTGRYDGSQQVLVTPLVVRSAGARIAVVRGLVTDPGQAVAPSTAPEVTVSGTLAPEESPTGDSAQADPTPSAGQMAVLDLSVLVNRWPGTPYSRWRPGHMVAVMLAGVVPFMSFWAERKVAHEVEGRLATQDAPVAWSRD